MEHTTAARVSGRLLLWCGLLALAVSPAAALEDLLLTDAGVLLGSDINPKTGQASFLMGETVETKGALGLSSSLLLLADTPLDMTGVTPGLWLAGFRPSALQGDPRSLQRLIDDTTFGLALDNRLKWETDKLSLSGFWTVVGSHFKPPKGSDDKGLSKLRGMETHGYSLTFTPTEGLTLKREFTHLKNGRQGHKTFGQETDTTVTSLSFQRGGTSFSHTVTESDMVWVIRGTQAHQVQRNTQLSHEFDLAGRPGKASFQRVRTEQSAPGQPTQVSGTNLLNGELAITADLTLAAQHLDNIRGRETTFEQTHVSLTSKKLNGASVGYHVTQAKPGSGKVSAEGFTATMPPLTVAGVQVGGEYAHAGPEIPTKKKAERAHVAASTAPLKGLKLSTDYQAAQLDSPGNVREDIVLDASYAVNPRVSLGLHNTTSKKGDEQQSEVTQVRLARAAPESGGLTANATVTQAQARGQQPVLTRQMQAAYVIPDLLQIGGSYIRAGEGKPSLRAEMTLTPAKGIALTGMYAHHKDRPGELRAQVAADVAPKVKAVASYASDYFDGTHGRVDQGDTVDLALEWAPTEELNVKAGVRATDTQRAFAGGVGPRLEVKGSFSETDDLTLIYLPERAATIGGKAVPFSAGIEDLPKKALTATRAASYLLRYTNIIDEEHLFVAYVQGGDMRLDQAEVKPGVNPFTDKKVWLELRTKF
ncbi:MAG: hypothetical protein ACE5R4_13145 [Armatimonadota bacterium]